MTLARRHPRPPSQPPSKSRVVGESGSGWWRQPAAARPHAPRPLPGLWALGVGTPASPGTPALTPHGRGPGGTLVLTWALGRSRARIGSLSLWLHQEQVQGQQAQSERGPVKHRDWRDGEPQRQRQVGKDARICRPSPHLPLIGSVCKECRILAIRRDGPLKRRESRDPRRKNGAGAVVPQIYTLLEPPSLFILKCAEPLRHVYCETRRY